MKYKDIIKAIINMIATTDTDNCCSYLIGALNAMEGVPECFHGELFSAVFSKYLNEKE